MGKDTSAVALSSSNGGGTEKKPLPHPMEVRPKCFSPGLTVSDPYDPYRAEQQGGRIMPTRTDG